VLQRSFGHFKEFNIQHRATFVTVGTEDVRGSSSKTILFSDLIEIRIIFRELSFHFSLIGPFMDWLRDMLDRSFNQRRNPRRRSWPSRTAKRPLRSGNSNKMKGFWTGYFRRRARNRSRLAKTSRANKLIEPSGGDNPFNILLYSCLNILRRLKLFFPSSGSRSSAIKSLNSSR